MKVFDIVFEADDDTPRLLGPDGRPLAPSRPATTPDAPETPRASANVDTSDLAKQGVKVEGVKVEGNTVKISGEYGDGTKFTDVDPEEARQQSPRHRAKVQRAKRTIMQRLRSAGGWGGIAAVLSALNAYYIFEDASTKIAEVRADMSEFRFRSRALRQEYYDSQMRTINNARNVNLIITALGGLASAIASATTARAVIAGLSRIGMLAGPVGWAAGLLVMAISEGAIFLLTWSLSKYKESLANWMWTTFWDSAIDALDWAGETAMDAISAGSEFRNPDEQGAAQALERDVEDGVEVSDDAKRAVGGGVNWGDNFSN
jgi:hypothetical protein